MAFTCGFFNSENGDRKYNAEQMSAIFDGIIADGVFTTIGDHLAVSAGTGMQVLVGTGKAWFDHTWNVNDAAYPLAIAASDVTLSRIDAIVLETNHSDSVRLNKLRVVQGTVASSPAKPTLTNSEKVHQHPLAWVTVAPGVTQIAASAIENAVGTSACPFVTGVIETTAIDDLFNQWNGEFDEWFDNLKAQLSDNVVANLQKQIDERVKIADKATSDDIAQGTNDSKWVTPKGLKDSNVGYQVGDILTTARTNLGDKWALCNGASIDRALFPELSNIRPIIPYPWADRLISGIHINDIVYANGYYVVCGYRPNDTYGYIAYTNSIVSSWTVKQITDHQIDYITYQNGYFVASSQEKILYTADPSSAWSSVTNIANRVRPIRVAYGNGYWVFADAGESSYDPIIYYSTNISGPYNSVSLWDTSANMVPIKSIRFINGYFVACGNWVHETNYVPTHEAKIAWTTNPASTWTTKTFFKTSTDNNINGNAIDIAYGRNTYMVLTNRTNSNGGTPLVSVYYSDSLSGTWTRKDIIQTKGVDCYTIFFDGSSFISLLVKSGSPDTAYAYYTSSLTDWVSYTIGSSNCRSMIYNGQFFIASAYDRLYVSDQTKMKLPSIATDLSYNYIKVKE